MPKIADVEPKPTAFCPCGSGLAFRICCHGKYQSRSAEEIEALLERGEAETALSYSRQFLTWYSLAHKAHTAPAIRGGAKGLEELLATDIEALETIADLVCRCLMAVGTPNQFAAVLDQLESAIDDPRWRDAVFALRAIYLWRVRDDQKALWTLLSASPQFAVTRREAVFMAWLAAAPDEVPVKDQRAILARLRKSTQRPSVLLHAHLLDAALYLVREDAMREAIVELSTGVADYRNVPDVQRCIFGWFKFGQTLALLGTITRDNQIMEEAIAAMQRFLAISGTESQRESRGMVLTECGELCAFMRQWDRAEAFLSAAISEEPTDPLPHIYLARVRLLTGSPAQARRTLRNAQPMIMSDANRVDFAFVATEIALSSKEPEDVESARDRLENCKAKGVFEARRIGYLRQLNSAERAVAAEEVPWWRTALKYVKLEPNFAGFGLKLDKMLEVAVEKKR